MPDHCVSKHYSPKTKVAVVIPFRNEKNNIADTFNCIAKQSYPAHLFNVYFVNDHSDDGGEVLLEKLIERWPNINLLHSDGAGKKNALSYAYKRISEQLIVTLDADCKVAPKWILSIVSYYEHTRKKFIINPVKLSPQKTLWDKIQVLEFQSLIASGAGAAGSGKPIMCNGANLAFESNLVKSDTSVLNNNFASGDDMFLMEHVKKQFPGKIGFLKSQSAISKTNTIGFKQFVNQRARWASKAGGYKSFDVLFSGAVVFSINILLFGGYLGLLFVPGIWRCVLFCWITKLLVDVIFLSVTSKFFKTQKLIILSPIIAVLYPLYVVMSLFVGYFGKFSWKGRKV